MSDKRRMFAALNQDEFQWEYVVNPVTTNPLQHAYEIIREGFPCKLYMDVEVILILSIDTSISISIILELLVFRFSIFFFVL